jgi:hypothetical protein
LVSTRLRILVWLVALLAAVAAQPAHAAPPGPVQIGFWCGPPPPFSTAAEFQRIEAAGFTFALPPCGVTPTVAENQATLAAAATTGVKVFVRDARIPQSMSEPDAAARLDAVVADYANQPALAGYDLADEPPVTAFAGLGEVVAHLRTRDPTHPAFVNVLPSYGAADYENYLERYATEAGTATFSFDFYPFMVDGDRDGFLSNLASMRSLSLRHARPFLEIGQATPHLAYRQPTEAEKRWQVLQSLAHGASGISYFTYWSVALEGFGLGIVGPDGTPTPQYHEVQRVNARAQAIGSHLVGARSVDVFQSPPDPGSVSPRRPGAAVGVSGDEPVTAGIFETGEHVYVLLVNGRTDEATSVTAGLSFGATLPEVLDPGAGTWSTVRATPVGTVARTPVTLAAGDAALFRMAKPVPPGPLGDESLAAAPPEAEPGCPPDFSLDGFGRCARSDPIARTFSVTEAASPCSYIASGGSWTCVTAPAAAPPPAAPPAG